MIILYECPQIPEVSLYSEECLTKGYYVLDLFVTHPSIH